MATLGNASSLKSGSKLRLPGFKNLGRIGPRCRFELVNEVISTPGANFKVFQKAIGVKRRDGGGAESNPEFQALLANHYLQIRYGKSVTPADRHYNRRFDLTSNLG
jgi:hypothetical protein